MIDAGDTIVALGSDVGIDIATGKAQNTQDAHIWRIENGKAVLFQQHTDTLNVARVTGAV